MSASYNTSDHHIDLCESPDPRVSVVMPAYNVGSCIETAVRSAMRQTERNLEIVIVDDGSSDDTRAIAERLAAEDPRIRVCPTPQNSGRMGAMNHGMRHARGRWIAVLDGDDWYAPDRLERLLDIAEARDLDLIADDWIAVDGKAGLCLESPLPRHHRDVPLDLDVFLAHSNPTGKADYGMLKHIVRTDFVRRTRIEYHPLARTGEDFYFLLSFFLAGGRGLLVDKAYYYYVEPFGTISRRWAQEGRRRYKFEILVAVNDDYLQKFGRTLTPQQRRRLEARNMGWLALITFHQVREAAAERRYGVAMGKLVRAPSSFWVLLGRRARDRLKTKLFGPSQKVLGSVEPGMIS